MVLWTAKHARFVTAGVTTHDFQPLPPTTVFNFERQKCALIREELRYSDLIHLDIFCEGLQMNYR